ncbi:hypothetical protein D3C81_1746390 [compost metagenome]
MIWVKYMITYMTTEKSSAPTLASFLPNRLVSQDAEGASKIKEPKVNSNATDIASLLWK